MRMSLSFYDPACVSTNTSDHEGDQLDPSRSETTPLEKTPHQHVIVVTAARRRQKRAHPDVFDVCIQGRDRIICSSRQPFVDAARVMLNEGLAAPEDRLVMRHAGSDTGSLSAAVAIAAKLSVEERAKGWGPVFVRWKPFITALYAAIEYGINMAAD